MSQRREKKGIDADESRRRREASAVAIRKDKKEESLLKRRNINITNDSIADASFPSLCLDTINTGEVSACNPPQLGRDPKNRQFSVTDIPELMEGLKSNDKAVQFNSIRGFRKMLSVERLAPVQECISCGAIPIFVEYLQRHDFPEAQFEAAWALTNVASTDQTAIVVEYGAIPYLCQLLTVASADLREQAAWCLGNVAGDSSKFRDLILHHGALSAVVANIMNPANVSLLRNCTWTLSNLCRGKPQPHLASISTALPALQNILLSNVDAEAMADAAWALSYICDGDNDRIQVVVNLAVIPTLVTMLQSGKQTFIVPALRTLGNIVSGDDSQTEAVLAAGVLSALIPLLTNQKKNVRKESLWMLSNIAAGSQHQVATLVGTPNLIPMILEQVNAAVDWDVRKEAAWVICNVASSGMTSHIMTLVDHGAISQLCSLLDISDVKMLTIILDALESILKVGRMINKSDTYQNLFDEAEGIDKLENLQEHESETIYKKAVHIIEEYFNGEEQENESENVKPVVNSNTFSFGMNAGKGTTFSFGNDFSKPANSFTSPGPSISQTPTQFTFGFPSQSG